MPYITAEPLKGRKNMLFLVYRTDKPGYHQLRLDNYRAHLDYLHPFKNRLVVGGPTLGPGDGTGDADMTGSFLIIEASGWHDVDAFVANDPFTKAGLFSTTIIERWKHGRHNDE
jgi:uncharacterized protein YciI